MLSTMVLWHSQDAHSRTKSHPSLRRAMKTFLTILFPNKMQRCWYFFSIWDSDWTSLFQRSSFMVSPRKQCIQLTIPTNLNFTIYIYTLYFFFKLNWDCIWQVSPVFSLSRYLSVYLFLPFKNCYLLFFCVFKVIGAYQINIFNFPEHYSFRQ